MGYDDYYPECGTCLKAFPAGYRARDNHCRSTGHCEPAFECDTCARHFGSEPARLQHMRDCDHFDTVVNCAVCGTGWASDAACVGHEHDAHLYCADCDRAFASANNLRMHLNSRAHLGQHVQCPFCQRAYTTAAGLTHHIESGACPVAAGMNREALYRLVRAKDPAGSITKSLLAWHGDAEYEVSDHSYNWACAAWECYLCHRLFGRRESLNQHLNSPAHQQKLYHCPSRICGKEFTSLAAIINHLESESCGCTRFSTVQSSIQGMVRGDRMISF